MKKTKEYYEKKGYAENKKMMDKLLKKGWYVMPIGRNEDIEYLVVSALPPKNSNYSDKPM